MKLINFKKDGKNTLGILTDRGVIDVAGFAAPGVPTTMRGALALGREKTIDALSAVVGRAEGFLDENSIEYAPTVDDPEKILCVGKNYASHVSEVPELFKPGTSPEIFTKFRNTLVGHGGLVKLNPNSQKHDYEAEIAVVIGRRASNVGVDEAMDHVFGYTLANDISARDLQKAASQWTPGKTCDTFCPLGPCLLTADEVEYDKMLLTGFKNGEQRQSGCSAEMIYSIPFIVSFLSGCCTLEPGDVILTGTPAGVIFGRPEGAQDWLKAGDTLEVHVPEIGTLRVSVGE